MATASWPDTLPGVQVGFYQAPQQGWVEAPTSTGPGKRRPRFSALSSDLHATALFTAAQKAAFDAWYGATLNHGTLEFTMRDPSTGSDATYVFNTPPAFTTIRGGDADDHMLHVTLSLRKLP